jgi:hypothetical protein
MMISSSRLISLTVPAIAVALYGAHAAEFCVTCEGPSAQYACQFDEPLADPNDPRMKLLCITELAKTGPHASCGIDRNRTPPCAGAVKHLALPQEAEGTPAAGADGAPNAETGPDAVSKQQPNVIAPENAGNQDAGQVNPGDGTAAAKNKGSPALGAPTETPPKTVEEMVKKSAKNTGEALEETGKTASDAAKKTGSALEKAGKAVGNAAKKTWKCLSTLFGDC